VIPLFATVGRRFHRGALHLRTERVISVESTALDADTERPATAIHEAGHAIVASDLGRTIATIELCSTGLRLGKELFGRAVTNEMHCWGHLFTETLQRLDQPLLDRRHLAINFMREGDQMEAAQRATRRAALISGVLPDKEARTA
jgi:hypothetical protein